MDSIRWLLLLSVLFVLLLFLNRWFEARQRKQAGELLKAFDPSNPDASARRRVLTMELAKAKNTVLHRLNGNNYVTPMAVIINGKQYPAEPNMRAQVDTSGQLIHYSRDRSDLTKGSMKLGANLILPGSGSLVSNQGKKTSDSRQLFIAVESDSWYAFTQVSPSLEASARQFAAAIVNLGKNLPAVQEEWNRRVVAFQEQLDSLPPETSTGS